MLPALGRILFRHHSPSRVWMPPSWWIRANPSAHASLRMSVSPRVLRGNQSQAPCPSPTCPVWSAPRYGCWQCPPGRFRGGTLHDPRRHPLSIPFDRCCPNPLHPRQILDAKEVAVLSPVRDDRLGLVWPHVRQSLLQRRRICCIDVDPVGCLRSPHQQQSQHQRLTRKPRPHLATPCGSEPVPAGYPVGSSSVPRHIHTAYRPQRLHTASQIPDVV